MRLLFCVTLALCAPYYLVAATVLEGTICDESKHPVLAARIKVYDGAKLLTMLPEPVSLQGKYRISLPAYQGDRVILEVDAPGYSSAKVTVVLSSNGTPIEPIVLRQQPGLVLGHLQEKESPDHKLEILEVGVSNAAATPVSVTGVVLLASAQSSIECADKSPGVISTIRQNGSELAVRISVPEEKWQEDEALVGKIEILPCGVTRLNLSFPVMWSFPGQKTDKLRLEIPMQITVPAGSSQRTINLKDMQTLAVRLVDDHQQTKDSKLQRENR